MTAVTCIHLSEAPQRRAFMERLEPSDPIDSGWSITCGGARHSVGEGQREHLTHICTNRPFLVPYLLMPIGSAVAFEPAGAVVFAPGSDAGRQDPGDPYAFDSQMLLA